MWGFPCSNEMLSSAVNHLIRALGKVHLMPAAIDVVRTTSPRPLHFISPTSIICSNLLSAALQIANAAALGRQRHTNVFLADSTLPQLAIPSKIQPLRTRLVVAGLRIQWDS